MKNWYKKYDDNDTDTTESLLDGVVGDAVPVGGRLDGVAGAEAQTTRGWLRDTG